MQRGKMDLQKLEWIEHEGRPGKRRKPPGSRRRKNTARTEVRRRRAANNRRLRRRRRILLIRRAVAAAVLLMAAGLIFGIVVLVRQLTAGDGGREASATLSERIREVVHLPADNRKWRDFYAANLELPAMDVQLLTVNEYSRPGETLPQVKNIFIHYTANPGTSAEQNRSYFQSLAETHERSASAHFIIGYEGEIVQCIPTREIAYAVMKRNYDSISIECCYLDENGRFTDATYDSLIELTAWLLHKYELTPESVLRHYDEGGKNCPKYYVENEGEWERFLMNLTAYMEEVSQAYINSRKVGES
ncbi:MAG: peptidoglycan recognition protein family protein [Lachnospiraceae bacterium]|nr:peptidoglycan recognition protein family protein [Lachnospiraceae bacterium]